MGPTAPEKPAPPVADSRSRGPLARNGHRGAVLGDPTHSQIVPTEETPRRFVLFTSFAILAACMASLETPAQIAAQGSEPRHPTARVYGSREGLVGSTTANGHVIAERDRFVALPSRDVISARNGTEFSVQLTYKGRIAAAPVWDLGPCEYCGRLLVRHPAWRARPATIPASGRGCCRARAQRRPFADRACGYRAKRYRHRRRHLLG